MVPPGASGWGTGSLLTASPIHWARWPAKATASFSRRAEGAVAITSRRAGSSLRLTRRERRSTFRRTGTPATSKVSPSANRLERSSNTRPG